MTTVILASIAAALAAVVVTWPGVEESRTVVAIPLWPSEKESAKPLWGRDNTLGQSFVSPEDGLSGVGAALANHGGGSLSGDIVLYLREEPQSAADLRVASIPARLLTEESRYHIFRFGRLPASAGRRFYFKLEAPSATATAHPVVRYEIDGASYSDGAMYVGSRGHHPGNLAFALVFTKTLGAVACGWVLDSIPSASSTLAEMRDIWVSASFPFKYLVAASILSVAVAYGRLRLRARSRFKSRPGHSLLEHAGASRFGSLWQRGARAVAIWQAGFLVIPVAVWATALVVWSFSTRQVVPPGDTFNFYAITDALSRFAYPHGEKRLPFYPVLLLPGAILLDPLLWASAVSMAAYIGSIMMFWLLTRNLGFGAGGAALAGLLLATSSPIVATAIRPLADSLFLFLYVTSLAVWSSKCLWRPAVLGVTLGLLSLTRFEGFALTGVLVASEIVQRPRAARKVLGLLMGAYAAVLAPWMVFMTVAQGAPLPLGYFHEAASTGYGAKTLTSLGQNLSGVVPIIAGASSQLVVEEVAYWLTSLQSGGPLRFFAVTAESNWKTVEVLAALASGTLVALGLIGAFRDRGQRLRLGVVVGAGLVHLGIAAWWAPYARFLLPVLPFVILLMVRGLVVLGQVGLGRVGPLLWPTALLVGSVQILAASVIVASSLHHIRSGMTSDNGRGMALLQAVRSVDRMQGKVAIPSGYTIGRIYLDLRLRVGTPRGMYTDAREIVSQGPSTLRAAGVEYLILHSEGQEHAMLRQSPEFDSAFNLVRRFEYDVHGAGTEWAEIYQIRRGSVR